VVFSPDGQRLAVGLGREVRLLAADDLREQTRLTGHRALVVEAAFTPDGAEVVTGSTDTTVRRWDAASGRELASHSFPTFFRLTTAVAFTPDVKGVLVADANGSMRLADTSTGQVQTTLPGDSREVWCAAFAPDGRTLLTATLSGTVTLWDAAAPTEPPTVTETAGTFSAVAFSPDGRLLATGSSRGTVRLWDAATGRQVAALPQPDAAVGAGAALSLGGSPAAGPSLVAALGERERARGSHRGAVRSLAFSPDGKTLASASADFTAKLWDVATGQVRAHLQRHTGPLGAVAFSTDGKLLATAGGDLTVKLWEAASGRLLGTLRGHTGAVTCLAFAPDGRTLATGGSDDLKLWDVAPDGRAAALPVLRQRPRSTDDTTHQVEWDNMSVAYDRRYGVSLIDLAFTADGQTLALLGSGGATLLDRVPSETGAAAWAERLRVPEVRGRVAFGPDGRTLVAGHRNGLALLDPVTGEVRTTLWASAPLAFAPDGQRLAAADPDGRSLRVWDARPSAERATLPGHSGILFARDGRTLISGWAAGLRVTGTATTGLPPGTKAPAQTQVVSDRGGAARLWDAATGQERAVVPWDRARALSPDGATLASADRDSIVRLWDVAASKPRATLPRAGDVAALAFGGDGRTLAVAGADGAVRLWDVPPGEEPRFTLTGHAGAVKEVLFAADGRTLATSGADRTIRLWDAATGQQRASLRPDDEAVTAMTFSPDGRLLATAGKDRLVKLWDAATGEARGTLKGHAAEVSYAQFAPDGATLATGCWDRLVLLWETATGRPRGRLIGRRGEGAEVAALFTPDGQQLLAADGSRAIRRLNVATGQELPPLEGHTGGVYLLRLTDDGRTLASAATDFQARNEIGEVKLWDVASGREAATLRGGARRGLADTSFFSGDVGGHVAMAFSPDGRTLAVRTRDSAVKLWDMEALRRGER
jgi:WD40 repeat protein